MYFLQLEAIETVDLVLSKLGFSLDVDPFYEQTSCDVTNSASFLQICFRCHNEYTMWENCLIKFS